MVETGKAVRSDVHLPANGDAEQLTAANNKQTTNVFARLRPRDSSQSFTTSGIMSTKRGENRYIGRSANSQTDT